MDHSIADRTERLVEELRSSGFRGQESWIAALPSPLGTRVVALRVLEVDATHCASIWLDVAGDCREIQQTIRDCFLPRALALTALFERTCPTTECPRILRQLNEQFDAELNLDELGSLIVSNLIAIMTLRQFHESNDVTKQTFATRSNNVHPDFVARCVRTLGWTPFDASEHALLTEVLARIHATLASTGFPVSSSKSLVF